MICTRPEHCMATSTMADRGEPSQPPAPSSSGFGAQLGRGCLPSLLRGPRPATPGNRPLLPLLQCATPRQGLGYRTPGEVNRGERTQHPKGKRSRFIAVARAAPVPARPARLRRVPTENEGILGYWSLGEECALDRTSYGWPKWRGAAALLSLRNRREDTGSQDRTQPPCKWSNGAGPPRRALRMQSGRTAILQRARPPRTRAGR